MLPGVEPFVHIRPVPSLSLPALDRRWALPPGPPRCFSNHNRLAVKRLPHHRHQQDLNVGFIPKSRPCKAAGCQLFRPSVVLCQTLPTGIGYFNESAGMPQIRSAIHIGANWGIFFSFSRQPSLDNILAIDRWHYHFCRTCIGPR